MQDVREKNETGSIIVTILVVMLFLSTVIFALMVGARQSVNRARDRIMLLQAQYAAESGADTAIAYLNAGVAFTGTTSDVTLLETDQFNATYSVSVAVGSHAKERIITSVGKVYSKDNLGAPRFTRTIQVIAEKSQVTHTTSVLSRNILSLGTNTQLRTGDVHVNGYISLGNDFGWNDTVLEAENITAVGRDTSWANCSIVGHNIWGWWGWFDGGHLAKPNTFTNPSQTKTQVYLGYNNCTDPPGNNSNADFDVFPNQTNLPVIESTYIPWSDFMDGTYTNAGSCTAWTSGGSPHNIPAVGSKASHFPNSGSGVTSSCGSNGTISLSNNHVYNINQHVHVRANLSCTGFLIFSCAPYFNNPTSEIKYVFIEGTINFDSVRTSSGSGPIVFVVYGADPPSLSGSCPYGGAAYIGGLGVTSSIDAPQLYILAMNGICINKALLAGTIGLGGFAGKNIYVSTSWFPPQTININKNFPVGQVPIDISWRAVRYQRL